MMSISKIAIIAIIVAACNLHHFGTLAAPIFPCCPGSQQLVALMHGYIVGFTSSVETDQKETMCQNVISDVKYIKQQMATMNKCVAGGGAKIVREIDAQLTLMDPCAYGLSFVRALFELAAKATGHLKSAKWETLSNNFTNQIDVVDGVGHSFNVNINKNVHFTSPANGDVAHQTVPSPTEVFNNPGKHSAY
ncbi:hypothetical protein niasHT_012890 [Heterodera trifolii]|uniref:Effector protein n=1 Tax=Heterodera trifolii TaxID=157864 RepID=A0ABD2KZ93_9BILA